MLQVGGREREGEVGGRATPLCDGWLMLQVGVREREGGVGGRAIPLCDSWLMLQEIDLVPQPSDGHQGCRYFMTLMRDDTLQVRVGDCVYVTQSDAQVNDRLATLVNSSDTLDILRVERLWKDSRYSSFWFLIIRATVNACGGEMERIVLQFN